MFGLGLDLMIICALTCAVVSGILGIIWGFKARHSNLFGVLVKRFIALNALESFVTPAVVMIFLTVGNNINSKNIAFVVLISGCIGFIFIAMPLLSLRWYRSVFRVAALQVFTVGFVRLGFAGLLFLLIQQDPGEFVWTAILLIFVTIASWFVLNSIQRQLGV